MARKVSASGERGLHGARWCGRVRVGFLRFNQIGLDPADAEDRGRSESRKLFIAAVAGCGGLRRHEGGEEQEDDDDGQHGAA
jgi:hypothetical protein